MVIGEVTMGVFYLASYLNCCSVLQSILKNVDIHLNRAQAGRSRLTACVRGFLWTTSQISIFAILLFIFESHSALLIFKILIYICNVSPLSRTQTSSRKHSEVLELIILWALVIWFVCSAPRGLIIFFVSCMTAGRDSMCYDSIPTHQFCWLKIQRWNNSNILFIRSFPQEYQTVEELA